MSSQRIRTRESASATPRSAGAKFTLANEFFLPRVQSLMPFPVMLAGKRFSTDGANKGSFICMRAEMAAEVIRTSKSFWTKRALECSRVFLDTFVCAGGRGTRRVGEFENVVAVGNRRGGGAAAGLRRRRDLAGVTIERAERGCVKWG